MSKAQSRAELGALRALRHVYGIEVAEHQLKTLGAALGRLGEDGGPDAALERLLRRDGEAWDVVIDAITIPETYFFRHYPHFERLREVAAERFRRGRPCRVLSAGCSSGEEVWSAAAVLADLENGRPRKGSVVGWDVNARRLIEASEGRYRDWSVRAGLHGYDRYFGRCGEYHRVSPELSPWARFERVNLVGILPDERFDVIFFRNVAIYFDPATARAVFGRLSALLEDDGMIFVGPSDPVTLPRSAWEHVIRDGIRAYHRAQPAPPAEHMTQRQAAVRSMSSRPSALVSRPRDRRRALRVREALPARNARRAPPKSESPSSTGPAALADVERLADEGAYSSALELLVSLGVESVEAFRWEGVLRLNLGEPAAAVDCFRRCVYLEPEDVAHRRWLALAYEGAGMNQEAERERRNARELGET